MPSLARSAVFLLSCSIASPCVFAQQPSSAHISPGARIVIAPMGGFETYFAAAVREKQVPVTLTLDRDSAQYFVVSTDTEWEGFVYGAGASWSNSGGGAAAHASSTRGLEASIMLIDAKTKDVVWAYEVHKSSYGSLLLGTLAARGQQSIAEACAKHLREFIEKGEASGWSDVNVVAFNSRDNSPSDAAARKPSSPPVLTAVTVSSTPAGADIFLDDDFFGNTPSTLNISAGKHVVTVKKAGFQSWVRSVSLSGGSITLSAELAGGTKGSTSTTQPASSSQKLVGWIGIHTQNNSDVAVVTNVNADGPGAKAGIQLGDVIVALDGRLMKGKDFEAAVAALKPGTQISVHYARGSSAHEVSLTVGSHN